MKNQSTLAYINLNAVLRNIQDLCRLDTEAKAMIQGVREAITFNIRGGGRATLVIRDGQCKMTTKKVKDTIHLYFTSCEHFNKMVDGEANPIPLKGLTKLKFLTGTFMELTKRLEYYLRPEPELLEDPAFKLIHTELTLYTAAYAIGAIGNQDPVGHKVAGAIPDGIIAMEIGGGPAVSIQVKQGHLNVVQKKADNPRSIMAFSDMDAAYGLLSGEVDSYTSIASEKLMLSGFIPMLDNLNKLLFKVSEYLK